MCVLKQAVSYSKEFINVNYKVTKCKSYQKVPLYESGSPYSNSTLFSCSQLVIGNIRFYFGPSVIRNEGGLSQCVWTGKKYAF